MVQSGTQNNLNRLSVVLGNIVILLMFCVSGCNLKPLVVPEPASLFTVATYNILYLNKDLSHTADLIRNLDADLVCLQETNPESETYLRRDLTFEYPHMYFYRSRRGVGPALLSKSPVRNIRYQSSSQGMNGYIFCEAFLGDKWVQVVNVHLHPLFLQGFPFKFALNVRKTEGIRKREIIEAYEYISPEKPLLVMGDFNSLHYFAAPRFLKKQELRNTYESALVKTGLSKTLNFRWMGIDQKYRVDYVFHTSDLFPLNHLIYPGYPSDHNPVVVTFSWFSQADNATCSSQPFSSPDP